MPLEIDHVHYVIDADAMPKEGGNRIPSKIVICSVSDFVETRAHQAGHDQSFGVRSASTSA